MRRIFSPLAHAPGSGLTSARTFQAYLESALEAKEQVGRLPAR